MAVVPYVLARERRDLVPSARVPCSEAEHRVSRRYNSGYLIESKVLARAEPLNVFQFGTCGLRVLFGISTNTEGNRHLPWPRRCTTTLGPLSPGATVSTSDLTAIINEYVCLSNGVAHHFKVQAVASEPRFGRRGHYFAAVKVLPEPDGPKTVHLMFQRSISRDALLKLLDDAVALSSYEQVAQGA